MFENIVGNNKVKSFLESSIMNNKISHSYLFIGIKGILKKDMALSFSKKIMCLESNENECCCDSCVKFENDNNPDYYEVNSNENSIKIDDIRKMQTQIYEKPIISGRKVILINNADKMTKEAQNCLLKTLEEPPAYITMILITSNIRLLIDTIKSRCIIVNFSNLNNLELKEVMKIKYNLELLDKDLDKAQGSVVNALKISDMIEEYEKIEYNIKNISEMDIIEFFNVNKFMYEKKEEINDMLEYLNTILFNNIKTNVNVKENAECINIIEDTKKNLMKNTNFDMCIDNMLIKVHKVLK